MINPINLAFQLISKEKVPNNIKEDVLHTFDNFIYHLEKKSETWLLSFAMASIKIYMEVYKFTGKSISRILQLMGALLVRYKRDEVFSYDIIGHMEREMKI